MIIKHHILELPIGGFADRTRLHRQRISLYYMYLVDNCEETDAEVLANFLKGNELGLDSYSTSLYNFITATK